jgi:hypothetical protein
VSPPEFNDHYDNLIARGFSKSDLDKGRFDLPQAVKLLVAEGLYVDEAREALKGALLSGRLHAGDQKGPDYFQELAVTLQRFGSRGVVQADSLAISRLSRGFAIPWESWYQWMIAGDNVNWETGEIARPFSGHVEIFTPVFRREDLLLLIPRPEPINERAAVYEQKSQGSHASAASSSLQSRSIRPKLKEAPLEGSAIRKALRTVYSKYPKRQGPNINQIVPLVRDVLENDGYTASKARIQKIAAEPEFIDRRGEVGKHRKRTPSSEK